MNCEALFIDFCCEKVWDVSKLSNGYQCKIIKRNTWLNAKEYKLLQKRWEIQDRIFEVIACRRVAVRGSIFSHSGLGSIGNLTCSEG